MKVFLTQRAVNSYTAIKGYIVNEFGEKVADAFEQKIIDFFDLLESFPELGTLEVAEKQIRAFQLTKQTRVFYRIMNNKIVILTFFDVRQDPQKKPK